ncbi:MAG: hypothetical protein HWE21_18955 [Cytophagia bacterium]|nr:hypothetical protein [Cytophagia bacterium]
MIRALLTFTFIVCAFAAQSQEDVTKKLQNRYLGFLIREGYDPEIDDDGDVEFTYNYETYYITIDANDENFFRIARLESLPLTEKGEIDRAIRICHDITKEKKVAKIYWRNDVIWTSTELLFADADGFEGIFDRAMELTEQVYDEFEEKWNEDN